MEWFYRKILSAISKLNKNAAFERQTNDELLARMRHDSHRIEKSVYNDIFIPKNNRYLQKCVDVRRIHSILESRGFDPREPTVCWSKNIIGNFDHLEKGFIMANNSLAYEPDFAKINEFIDFLRCRRSVRVWAKKQPDKQSLSEFADKLINAAIWAPNSGNRQAWRFKPIILQEEKNLLLGIKEQHCVQAPALIFVGMDSRLYGAFAKDERCLYIDAGAAIMQMVLAAHRCGIGTCWNHFADDLIVSRGKNREAYNTFAKIMNIPDYISPVAIIAFGIAKYNPPMPARMDNKSVML